MKKGFTLVELIGVIIILALIMLLAVPPILNSIRSTRNELSDASKKIIYTAANLYVSENLNDFPKNEGNTFCVSIDTLSKKEYLPTIVYDSATGDEIPKDSLVEIKVENNNYTYNMNNECVEYIYTPPNLISTLLEQYSSSNKKGLVKDSTNSNLYYYTGTNNQVTNNFLWYGGHQWRVLEFDTSAKTITLVSQQPLTSIQPASAVWETKEAYDLSYINKWLNVYFWNCLDSSIQSNIQDSTFNVGIYSDVDEITTTHKVGLLDQNQYEKAGGTDSYLDIKDYFWLENRYDLSRIRYVNDNGVIGNYPVSANLGVRAVIKISDITINKGDGSLVNNYRVENKAKNTNEVLIGEYINLLYSGDDNACGSDNRCTFRVVSKDSDSIKVVLNGLLPKTSAFGDSTKISTSHTIYTKLNKFAEGISNTYKYMGNKTFYIGEYLDISDVGQNYENIKNEQLQANIGLPTVGELFGGNDIDLSQSISKTFVDVKTIENPTVSNYYWTMNRSSSKYVREIVFNGTLFYASPSTSDGVRPVIYLKNNLELTGEGTAQSPYILQ